MRPNMGYRATRVPVSSTHLIKSRFPPPNGRASSMAARGGSSVEKTLKIRTKFDYGSGSLLQIGSYTFEK